MKDLTKLKVKEIRVFREDVIPIEHFYTSQFMNSILQLFKFKSVDPVLDQNKNIFAINFYGGEFEKNKIIESLVIEARRILFTILSDSNSTNLFYEKLQNIIIDVVPELKKTKPIIKAEESSCIVTLGVNFKEIFSAKFLKFLDNDVSRRLAFKEGKLELFPDNFNARIKYFATTKKLRDYGVAISDKKLTIKPVKNTPLKDRVFFISAPTDSNGLIEIIKEFEKAF